MNNSKQEKIRIAFLLTTCRKGGPVQQMLYIIKKLDKRRFEPVLVTLYPEWPDVSQLDKYKEYAHHYFADTGKLTVIAGRMKKLRKILKHVQPDVIHSFGVFPDYAVSRIGTYRQVLTLRIDNHTNIVRYGLIRGSIMRYMQNYAVRHADKVLCCSKSLSDIYKKELGIQLDFIRNGVDSELFHPSDKERKMKLRKQLGLEQNAKIFIYMGRFFDIKNQAFLLQAFHQTFPDSSTCLILLGDGPSKKELEIKYKDSKNIIFPGHVLNVDEYLNASDYYVSVSKMEGLPNAVMEGMSGGLPVVLSDIPQHKEIYSLNPKAGCLYQQGNLDSLCEQLQNVLKLDWEMASETARRVILDHLKMEYMTDKYQKIYLEYSGRDFGTKT